LGEDIANFVEIQLLIQFYVRDLKLLRDTFKVLVEQPSVLSVPAGGLAPDSSPAFSAKSSLDFQYSSYPCDHLTMDRSPRPTTARGNFVSFELLNVGFECLLPGASPVVLERLVVRFLHETINADK